MSHGHDTKVDHSFFADVLAYVGWWLRFWRLELHVVHYPDNAEAVT